jgi:hypothetical protein
MDHAKTSTDGQVHEKNGYQRYYCEKGTYALASNLLLR